MRYNLSATQRSEMREAAKAAAITSVISFFTGAGAAKRIALFAWEAITTTIIWCAVLVAIDIAGAEFGLLTGSSEGTMAEVAAKSLSAITLWQYVVFAGVGAITMRAADIVLPAYKRAQQDYVSSLGNRTK